MRRFLPRLRVRLGTRTRHVINNCLFSFYTLRDARIRGKLDLSKRRRLRSIILCIPKKFAMCCFCCSARQSPYERGIYLLCCAFPLETKQKSVSTSSCSPPNECEEAVKPPPDESPPAHGVSGKDKRLAAVTSLQRVTPCKCQHLNTIPTYFSLLAPMCRFDEIFFFSRSLFPASSLAVFFSAARSTSGLGVFICLRSIVVFLLLSASQRAPCACTDVGAIL